MKWSQIDPVGLIGQLAGWGLFLRGGFQAAKCSASLWLVTESTSESPEDILCSFLQLEDEGEQKGNAV